MRLTRAHSAIHFIGLKVEVELYFKVYSRSESSV
jgi:hypothetical protein